MAEQNLPSTQQMLLDHLRRIIEGVEHCRSNDGRAMFRFGLGRDAVETSQHAHSDADPMEVEVELAAADGFIRCSPSAVKALDVLGRPLHTEAMEFLRQLVEEEIPVYVDEELLQLIFTDNPASETLRQVFAAEMLQKLDDMVDRSRKAVQKWHLLEKIPESVDRYVGEAAACFRHGFDLATVALCRAALEEALKDKLRTKLGEKALRIRDDRTDKDVDAELHLLIERATGALVGILSPFLATEARKVKGAGNACIHGKLDHTQVKTIARDTLVRTRQILSQLYS